MLYDPKWDPPAKTKPRKSRKPRPEKPTIEGFILWLSLQPENKRYRYMPPNNCVIGKYYKSIGTTYKEQSVDRNLERHFFWNYIVSGPRPHTMGAATVRALALYASGG